MRCLPFLVLGAGAFLFGCDSAKAQAQIDFADVAMIIEINDTDGDAGIQIFVDGKPYRKLRVLRPNGTELLDVVASDSVALQGLSEFFFESGEPSFAVVPLADFLARFPEGQYRFIGESTENEVMNGEAEFTHDIPDAPNLTNPQEDDIIDSTQPLVIQWDAVTTPVGIVIEGYQVIVGREDGEGTIEVELPAGVTSFPVPAEFFVPDAEYKVEVLAIEESGNQTITEVPFFTGP